jgi:hypothetical protein
MILVHHTKSRNGWNIPGPVARGTEDLGPIPSQNLSYLRGDGLHSSHMAPG